MPLRRFGLGLAVGLLWLPLAAQAIVIEMQSGKRHVGYVVRDDGKTLIVRERGADGKEEEISYDRVRSKFKILSELDGARLIKLSRDNPMEYLDYAQALAEVASTYDDPEARDTAMRLFLIAAYLDPQKYGPSSLLSMSALADTPAEARKCRALAFLLDPKGNASLLKPDAVKPAQLPKAQADTLQEFLKALAYYRAGQIDLARKAAESKGMDTIFSMAPGMTDKKAFLQRCTDASCATCKGTGKVQSGMKSLKCVDCDGSGGNQALAENDLRSVLRAELWAIDQLAGSDTSDKPRPGATNWASILEARQLNPVTPLSLETITEFNPRKCLYRNGVWVLP